MPTVPAPWDPDGPPLSRLALGTMTFGAETGEDEAFRQLDRFVAAGGTLLDTADVYGDGASEEIIGRWWADRRPTGVLLATKGRFAPPGGSAGASREGLRHALAGSLRRLGREDVDLYLVHGWDPDTPVAETLAVLTDAVEQGLVRQVGWSNVTGWQLQLVLGTAEAGGFVRPVVVQPQYNLLDRGIELEVLPCSLAAGLAVTPWSPLGGGWLTGKYAADARPRGATRLGEDPDRGVEAYDRRNTPRTWRVLDEVRALAAAHDRPPAHVALAWLLTRPGVVSVLLGARTDAQLADLLAAADLELTAEEVARLTAVSAPGLPPYPYGLVAEACGATDWDALGTATR